MIEDRLNVATPTQEEISEELDKALLAAVRAVKSDLEAGAKVADLKGAGVMLNVARQRMRDLGISKVATPGDAAALLAAEIGLSLDDMPEQEEMEEQIDAGHSRDREVGRPSTAAG